MKIMTKLSNGSELELDTEDPDKFINTFIDVFLKPLYKKSNDWNETLMKSIDEVERICTINRLSRVNYIHQLLNAVEERLPKDISQLSGVDKIEIIFEGLEDYVKDIQDLVKKNLSQEEKRLKVSALVENLNLFEITELLIHFAGLSLKK